jgi:hypothetical protein
MKKFTITTLTFALLLAITVSSCKKDDNKNNQPTPPANTPPQVNTPGDGYGVLGVARVLTNFSTSSAPGVPSMEFDYIMGLAFAGFKDSPNANTFLDAGNVVVNDSALAKSANNYYSFTPKGAPNGNDMGLNTTLSTYNWSVSGSSSVAGFTYVASGNLPGIGKIKSSKDVNTSSSYTITLSAPATNCDSVLWIMIGPKGSVQHTTAPNTSSYTFSASEVGSIGKGDNMGLLQVAAYRVNDFSQNGKKYYYVRESVATLSVNLK